MKRMRNLHPAWIVAGIGLAVLLWVGSGMLGDSQRQADEEAEKTNEPGAVTVQVRDSQAEPLLRKAVVSVTVRAETSGQVVEVVAQRGSPIKKNAVIARLAQSDRQAQLRQAKALREQRQLQYQAAQ